MPRQAPKVGSGSLCNCLIGIGEKPSRPRAAPADWPAETSLTQVFHRTRVLTAGVEPSLHFDYKHSCIKPYCKLLRAQRLSDECMLGEEGFELVHTPLQVGCRRAGPALRGPAGAGPMRRLAGVLLPAPRLPPARRAGACRAAAERERRQLAAAACLLRPAPTAAARPDSACATHAPLSRHQERLPVRDVLPSRLRTRPAPGTVSGVRRGRTPSCANGPAAGSLGRAGRSTLDGPMRPRLNLPRLTSRRVRK